MRIKTDRTTECPTCGGVAYLEKEGAHVEGSEKARGRSQEWTKAQIRQFWRCSNPDCNYDEQIKSDKQL